MTSTPGSSPTWYDVLGVPSDAGTDEIKAAWRTATDRFEPGSGSGQFRMFNEAADVLLDPERRRAYDATLPAAPATPTPSVDLTKDAPPPPAPEPEPALRSTASRPAGEPASRGAVIVAVVLALLTVAALALAGWFAMKVRADRAVADARDEAPAAAERATKAILSYDYTQLSEDRKRAEAYLTDDYAKEYEKTFTLLEKQKDGTPGAAVQTRTTVTASVLGSGVMDAEDDRVRVLVFVNQVSKRPERDPQIFQNRVAVTLEKHGERWLVDDLKSY